MRRRGRYAPLWHPRLLPLLGSLRLTLLVGSYAQAFVLGPGATTARVAGFAAFLPQYFPLPHPSWRTLGWEQRNPWFAREVLPALRAAVAAALAPAGAASAPAGRPAQSASRSSRSISASLKPK